MMEVDTAGAVPHSFHQFAQALSACKSLPSSSLLDPAEGLALLFADACQVRAEAGSDPLDEILEEEGNDDGDSLDWKLEGQTWRIIHLLHAERRQRSQTQGHDVASTSKHAANPYQTPFSAVQDILERDAGLSELNIVRDWLSSNLKCTHPVEVRKGYWPFTKNRLRNEKRLNTASRSRMQSDRSSMIGSIGKGVKSLDPDAVSREMSTLELEDAVYEKALNKTLFEYVRAGQLDSAIDLARQADRSWRAASLRGASLYWRPGLNDEMEEINSSMGNRNRALWKAVCRSLCSKTTVDEYERGLYGALSGDLKSVLAVSTSWESQLWAHTNARLEALVDDKLDKLGLWWGQDAGSRFSIPSTAKEQGAVRLNQLNIPNVLHDLGEQSQFKDVFLNLSQSTQHAIQIQAEHPFRVVQRAVILSDIPRLLEYIDTRLPVIKADSSPRQYARIVRFFAHLTLYLRLLKWDPMPDPVVCNSILKAYVEILEGLGEDDLVALYASSLEAESATESYAHYLKLMDVNEPIEAKRTALLRAEMHDLDVAAVALSTVSMIFAEVFPSMIPALTGSKTALAELRSSITVLEERLIRAIDWLCIHQSTRQETIRHVNIVMRLFLINGRLNAARMLLFDLPSSLIQGVVTLESEGDDAEAQAMEFVHWRSFFDALGNHLSFFEFWSKRPSQGIESSRIERHNWVRGFNHVVELAETSMMELLQMDWLKFDIAADGQDIFSERRQMELARIRQLYIPEIVFRLHFMFYEVREDLPQYLAKAIELPNLVADEGHKLYLEFVTQDQNRLQEYLGFVRLAHLAGLEHNADPFGLLEM